MRDVESIKHLVYEMVEKYTNPFSEERDSVQLLEELCYLSKQVVLQSKKMDLAITLSIADTTGECIFSYQMPGSLLASRDIAKRKAYTAVAMKATTKSLHDSVQPHRPLYQLETITNGKIVTFPGGIPLFSSNNQLLGAIGVSGALNPEDDHFLAELFREEFAKLYFSS
ncbi:hypothetical protein CHH55_09830 [Niallia circulans]|jgi:uncharacterized protein GlcG (DUF336 family)|uniref:GlcG/HbpS family heme-binding protein n=1 Tax=Niallia circulans TaxID=1397 RepID=UPI000BA623F2|nr:heme-binding protein [Niallia circulans]PAD88051.1 hypothetical protein CHH55_09830 [Niallia circulans]